MSKLLIIPLMYLGVILSVTVNISGCNHTNHRAKLPPPHVDVMAVKKHDTQYLIDYPATVSGVADYSVIPRVSGVLFKQLYQEGTYVKKDQPLYQIDPRPYENQLIADKGQRIKDLTAQQQYKLILDRYENLYKINAVSKQDVETATINYKSAVGQVQTDMGNISNDKLNIEYCLVKAPVVGLIAERIVTIGQMVTAYQTTLNYINSKTNLYINFSVPESDRLQLQSGIADGRIIVPANYKFKINLQLADETMIKNVGMVNFFDTRISLQNGAWNMRADVNNNEIVRNKLLSGQFVHVYLIGAKFNNVIEVPQVAVYRDNVGAFVYVINQNDVVERRGIKPGFMNGDNWIIDSGLSGGERVIINGGMKVVAGVKVIIDSLV